MNKFLPKITPFLAPANIAEIESAQQKSYPARKLPEIGEIRIPAIAEINHTLYAFFDVRPKPKGSLNGNEFNGKTLASDLPNPNQIYYCPLTAPLHSQPLHTLCPQMPQISSDTAIATDPFSGEIHIAFASIPENSQTGYFDSRYDGEHLLPGLLFGTDLNTLTYRPLTELYEILPAPDGEPLHPDAIFATSGSSITHNGAALLPYIARKGKTTFSYVIHFRAGEIAAISDPITTPNTLLDESTLAKIDGKIWINSRVQGFVGVGSGQRYLANSTDGIHFTRPVQWLLPDPGCNAKQIGKYFIHPHCTIARKNGAIINLPEEFLHAPNLRISDATPATSQPIVNFGSGSFGYCDAAISEGKLAVLFEYDHGLSLAELPDFTSDPDPSSQI